ncbi:hypothetical protein [Streptomyces sp. NPDC001380]|uniref:hypothetical protein n=1 Tax=Streptomyces sp. NPDC001380 TaxID=3364566 RepID=UPI0036844D19
MPLREGVQAAASSFEDFSTFQPADAHRGALTTTLDQAVTWANALTPLRTG